MSKEKGKQKNKNTYTDIWTAIVCLLLSFIPLLNLVIFFPLTYYFSIRQYSKSKQMRNNNVKYISIALIIISTVLLAAATFSFYITTTNVLFKWTWLIVSFAVLVATIIKAKQYQPVKAAS